MYDRYLSSRFDIDFLSLTYTRDGADVRAARAALKECNLLETKIIAKVAPIKYRWHHRFQNYMKLNFVIVVLKFAV